MSIVVQPPAALPVSSLISRTIQHKATDNINPLIGYKFTALTSGAALQSSVPKSQNCATHYCSRIVDLAYWCPFNCNHSRLQL